MSNNYNKWKKKYLLIFINLKYEKSSQIDYAIAGDKNKAFSFGCDDYLTKPLNPALLLEKIGVWLSC